MTDFDSEFHRAMAEKMKRIRAAKARGPAGRYSTQQTAADKTKPTTSTLKQRPHDRWHELHQRSYRPVVDKTAELKWIAKLASGLESCGCSRHWADLIEAMPPTIDTPAEYEAWAVEAHNQVNRRLGKPELTIAQAREAHAPLPDPDGPPALWIAGYPSLVGGADTELWHMIRLWRANGLDVHLVPSDTPDPAMRKHVDAAGAFTHVYRRGIFAGRTVASWCNGWFLDTLPEIIADGRPKRTIWANCMTWLFPKELEAHRQGWIDLFMFQSDYQRGVLRPQLEAAGPVRELEGFRAYFDPAEPLQGFAFEYREPADHFAVGRISRADPSKFAADTWQMFDSVRERSPKPVKAFILGYSAEVEAKIGKPPETLDYMHWTAGAVPAAGVLGRLHCLMHKTGGSRENWPRTVLEAMASGVPVVAERAYGLPEMIQDGVSGFLCDTSEQMIARAAELAGDEPKRRRMIDAARDRLAALADPALCWRPWGELFKTGGSAGTAAAWPRPASVSLRHPASESSRVDY